MSSVKIQGSATGTANFTIAVPDGTSTDRTINLPDAAGSFVLADGSNNVTVTGDLTVDTDTLYVDSANNRVGVGTASPSHKVHIADATTPELIVEDTTNNVKAVIGADNSVGRIGTDTNHDVTFRTNDTERARIDSDGRLLVNTTSSTNTANRFEVRAGAAQYAAEFRKTDTNDQVLTIFRHDGATGGTSRALLWFENSSGTGVGSIKATGSATSFNTSSDYRLKENVTELTGAIDRIKQVPVHRFNFISDPDKTVDGFLAHEVQSIVPEAIHGTKDEVDEEGNPVYQGIDQSKLVPLLTAAIKEQQALIEDLQTRLAALEAV